MNTWLINTNIMESMVKLTDQRKFELSKTAAEKFYMIDKVEDWDRVKLRFLSGVAFWEAVTYDLEMNAEVQPRVEVVIAHFGNESYIILTSSNE